VSSPAIPFPSQKAHSSRLNTSEHFRIIFVRKSGFLLLRLALQTLFRSQQRPRQFTSIDPPSNTTVAPYVPENILFFRREFASHYQRILLMFGYFAHPLKTKLLYATSPGSLQAIAPNPHPPAIRRHQKNSTDSTFAPPSAISLAPAFPRSILHHQKNSSTCTAPTISANAHGIGATSRPIDVMRPPHSLMLSTRRIRTISRRLLSVFAFSRTALKNASIELVNELGVPHLRTLQRWLLRSNAPNLFS